MAETVRSVSELLDVLFASNQAPRSITEQDVRDAIVSISLETADFSDLPRSSVDLQVGRCWIDLTTALRVVTAYLPGLATSATLAGSGSLFADPQILGRVILAARGTTAGAGSFAANASAIRQAAAAKLLGAGAPSATAVMRERAISALAGDAGLIAIPSPTVGGAFASAFVSAAFNTGGSLSTQQNANATLSPTSSIIATPQRSTTTTWDPAAKSI